MLTSVMEHGLEVMEAVLTGGTRQEKKSVRAACDELDAALDHVSTEQATQLAEQCEAQQLAQASRVAAEMGKACINTWC